MYSILIPIFNQSVHHLVQELVNQAEDLGYPYEIHCLEDGSTVACVELNLSINQFSNVHHHIRKENLGRSISRNQLTLKAKYAHLIFLDADSKIIDSRFIIKYLSMTGKAQVVYGGRVYNKTKPNDPLYLLHWKYGTFVESQNAKWRNKKEYISFMSNNYFISKKLALDVPYDESIINYGYEDLALSHSLEKRRIKIHHIDNSVLHCKLDTVDEYLKKIKEGISNLYQLHMSNKIMRTSLIRHALFLQQIKCDRPIYFLLKMLNPSLKNNLISAEPRLRNLQLLKLYYFLKERRIIEN